MKVIQRWASICRIFVVLITGGVLAAQDSKPLPAPASPGQAIQDAAKAAADDLAHNRASAGAVEILTGTQGVDFSSYAQKVSTAVRTSWSLSMPPEARVRTGTVTVEFAVLPDGKIGAMKLVSSSDDDLLDRAAWKAIKAAAPFPALPKAFTGPNLRMRFRFRYLGKG
jgi:TonB family protein